MTKEACHPITGEQCREARRLLGLSQLDLALDASTNPETIVVLEKETRPVRRTTRLKVRATLESAGVEFTDGVVPGVRLRDARGR